MLRTPPLYYSRGVCNKPVAQLIESNKSTQDGVLFVSDRNARNLVQPQVKKLLYMTTFCVCFCSILLSSAFRKTLKSMQSVSIQLLLLKPLNIKLNYICFCRL